jgi:hypothetical protein
MSDIIETDLGLKLSKYATIRGYATPIAKVTIPDLLTVLRNPNTPAIPETVDSKKLSKKESPYYRD